MEQLTEREEAEHGSRLFRTIGAVVIVALIGSVLWGNAPREVYTVLPLAYVLCQAMAQAAGLELRVLDLQQAVAKLQERPNPAT